MVHFRFIALVPMAFGILSSLLMSVVGAGKAIQGIQIYFSLGSPTGSVPVPLHLDRADQAMIAVIESVDAFLISIALLVFSMGVYTLFIRPVSQATHAGTAAVFQINSVSRLKQALPDGGHPGHSVRSLRQGTPSQ